MSDDRINLPNVHLITDRTTHDAAINQGQGTRPECLDGIPTCLYVSSASNPACKAAYPRILGLAETYPHVQVHVMELTPETTPMIKFGVQNCPIFIFLQGKYCETILGPDFRRIEVIFKTILKPQEK